MRAAHAESAVGRQPDNAALHALVLAEYGRKAAWAREAGALRQEIAGLHAALQDRESALAQVGRRPYPCGTTWMTSVASAGGGRRRAAAHPPRRARRSVGARRCSSARSRRWS
jgi:hypothetical protein